MKKCLFVLCLMLFVSTTLACEQGGATKPTKREPVASTEVPSTSKKESKKDRIDVDLTKLSSTMVYSEVYNMMNNPKDYLGKKVKMKGKFAIYHATDTAGNIIPDMVYYACVIADATACCSQGLEFVLKDNANSPSSYPEVGMEIEVEGTFRTYMEGTSMYCHLVDATLKK